MGVGWGWLGLGCKGGGARGGGEGKVERRRREGKEGGTNRPTCCFLASRATQSGERNRDVLMFFGFVTWSAERVSAKL